MSEEDHYAVLGLPSGIEGTKVSESEIRKAYKAKALKYQPHKRPDDPTAAERFKAIQTSYEILVDASARKAFDNLLKLKHEQQQEVSAKRRKMMDELEEEDRAFASNAKSQADMDREEIERATKIIEEEIARILSMKAKQASSIFSSRILATVLYNQCLKEEEIAKIIEVTWRHSKDV